MAGRGRRRRKGGSDRRRQKRPEAVGGTGSGGVTNDGSAENATGSDTNLMQHRINGTEPLPRQRRQRAGGTAEGENPRR